MKIPTLVGNNENDGIIIQTRRGSDISNSQSPTISAMLTNSYHRLRGKFPRAIPRSEPSGFYNCHGLVFASRRTAISEPEEILKILEHDCYVEISNPDDVLPGDVVLYLSEDGDPEHSGIVTCAPSQRTLRLPYVVSKWGDAQEFLHLANHCPYDFRSHGYYRVNS